MTGRSWDDLERLNESDDYGTSWTPTKDTAHPNPLAGVVRGYEQSTTEFENGLKPWICKVEDRAGKLWSVWLFGKVLVDEFTVKRPEPGERIVLRYIGLSDNPKPGRRAANLYRLTVDRELSLAAFLPAQLTAGDDTDDDRGFKAAEPVEPITDAEVVEGEDGFDDIPF